jgi:heme oxygenase
MGVAWVLAGSNLGNRMMAAQLARRDALPRASRFLNDDCSAAYWKGIQPRITAPVSAPSAHAAMQAAHAAFDYFAHVAQTHIRKAAA